MEFETINIKIPSNEAVELYRFCSEKRFTLDELVEQFMLWCVRELEVAKTWYESMSLKRFTFVDYILIAEF